MESLLHPPHTAYIEQRAMTDAGWRWLAWSDRAIVDEQGRIEAIIGVGRDITLRREVKEELRQSKDQLQNILDNSTEWIWEMDVSGHHIYSNNILKELLGYSPEEFMGSECMRYLHPDDLLEVQKALPGLISEKRGWREWVLRWRHRDGSYRYLESNAKPIFNAAGEVVGYRGSDRDISERKATEAALHAATQAAEAANHSKSLFLAKVSHEIRTPLTAIVGYGEMMEDAALNSEHRNYLAAINAASHSLSLLINDILDLSKIDAGELVIKQKDIRLRSFMAKLADMQKEQVARKGLELEVDIGAEAPDLLVGDPLRMQQVMLNLLSNAVKFTEQGSIGIAVVVAEESDSRVLLDISVTDTGIGVAAELHERIFEPFEQGFDFSTHRYAGSGLGLSISRSLADLMGGSVSLESQEGAGSTFHLLIPLLKKIDDISSKPQPREEPLPWSGPALNILLADDTPINVQFIRTVLEKSGHQVMVAENGKVALDKLHANAFDLVLMDIQMPVMDGVDALKVLREQERLSGKHLIVIALTAYALMGDREKYLKMGFDGYLSKPFTTRALLSELTRVLPVCS
jgi:PAS domain S-box-containing protein